MLGRCGKCWLQKIKDEADLDERATWYQWERVGTSGTSKERKEHEKGQENAKKLEAATDLLGLKKCFSAAPALPGIAKFHSLKPLKNGLILCRFYSYQSTWVEMGVQIPGSEDEDIEQSDSDEEGSADEEDSGKEEGDCISNAAKCSSYKECSSEREEEDSASDADEDGSREEEEEDSVSGEEGSSGPDEEERASNADKGSSEEEEVPEQITI
ncbi:cytoskeletal protein binding protein [Desmophyllum pertusum]|uniref:Cytoskeletal protein binding protein n=1 Tax=Desmophyllum pertusum TaxID=174260 RepID=A0A9X0D0S6_9CNID|nr:cytoskeletal protein binding protein [Desmophyllum pertusum]